MGLFDKVKNLFTEEIEEEPIKKEVRHVEVSAPKVVETQKKEVVIPRETIVEKPKVEEKKEEPTTREEKFVFFSDEDFKDLERPKPVEVPKKIEKPEPKPVVYNGATPRTNPEPKKEFKPSPIISPVYGVLNKNYQKEEIKRKVNPRTYRSSNITIDDVRNKAYGTLEDEIKDDILGKVEEPVITTQELDIDIFDEVSDIRNIKEPELIKRSPADVDEIFGRLNNKKDEILDELDNKKDEILDELDNKKESLNLLTDDFKLPEIEEVEDEIDNSLDIEESFEEINEINDIEDNDFDDETEALARELEEQKQKLEEINEMMNETKKTTKTKSKKKKVEKIEEDLDDSELFDLIDSMYENKGDE